jgi:hypothetical protein
MGANWAKIHCTKMILWFCIHIAHKIQTSHFISQRAALSRIQAIGKPKSQMILVPKSAAVWPNYKATSQRAKNPEFRAEKFLSQFNKYLLIVGSLQMNSIMKAVLIFKISAFADFSDNHEINRKKGFPFLIQKDGLYRDQIGYQTKKFLNTIEDNNKLSIFLSCKGPRKDS